MSVWGCGWGVSTSSKCPRNNAPANKKKTKIKLLNEKCHVKLLFVWTYKRFKLEKIKFSYQFFSCCYWCCCFLSICFSSFGLFAILQTLPMGKYARTMGRVHCTLIIFAKSSQVCILFISVPFRV